MAYRIKNLEHYPQNGKHQVIVLDIHPCPLSITKGEDEWYYYNKDGAQVKTKPNLWYVFVVRESGMMINSGFLIKGFRKPEQAIKYALSSYRKWLRIQAKKVKDFVIEELA